MAIAFTGVVKAQVVNGNAASSCSTFVGSSGAVAGSFAASSASRSPRPRDSESHHQNKKDFLMQFPEQHGAAMTRSSAQRGVPLWCAGLPAGGPGATCRSGRPSTLKLGRNFLLARSESGRLQGSASGQQFSTSTLLVEYSLDLPTLTTRDTRLGPSRRGKARRVGR